MRWRSRIRAGYRSVNLSDGMGSRFTMADAGMRFEGPARLETQDGRPVLRGTLRVTAAIAILPFLQARVEGSGRRDRGQRFARIVAAGLASARRLSLRHRPATAVSGGRRAVRARCGTAGGDERRRGRGPPRGKLRDAGHDRRSGSHGVDGRRHRADGPARDAELAQGARGLVLPPLRPCGADRHQLHAGRLAALAGANPRRRLRRRHHRSQRGAAHALQPSSSASIRFAATSGCRRSSRRTGCRRT